MLKNPGVAVISGSVYLFLYCTALQFESLLGLAWLLFAGLPLMLVWVVYAILKHGQYKGPALDQEEFGYQDRDKDTLGIF